jgi:hypothetical protein
MAKPRRRPLRRKDDISSDLRLHEVPRWMLPLPPERRDALPFVFDPITRHIVAPWARGPTSLADERRLYAALDRIAALDRPPRRVVWIWADPDREPVPIEGVSQSSPWLAHWARARATYVEQRR